MSAEITGDDLQDLNTEGDSQLLVNEEVELLLLLVIEGIIVEFSGILGLSMGFVSSVEVMELGLAIFNSFLDVLGVFGHFSGLEDQERVGSGILGLVLGEDLILGCVTDDNGVLEER